MSKFKVHYDAEAKSGMELSVNVCSSGYWPTSTNIPYHLPAELATACEKFKRFYLNQHNGHKLIWHMDKGRAEVLVHFSPKVSRTLVGTTYQAMIMLSFNTTKIISFKQILDFTGVPKYEIAHHLLSLAHPKVAVLLKKPASKTLEENHQFMINPKYSAKLLKVVIPLMPALKREEGEGGDEEAKIIEMQRRHQMDAAIVRIMKIRKTMKHPLLVAEVISQLKARFVPKPGIIKKRIEALIEQEYLERDKADRSVYKYLA
jgi:cullin 3